MTSTLTTSLRDESGSTVVEYALISALMSITSLAAFGAMGTATADMFNAVAAQLANPT